MTREQIAEKAAKLKSHMESAKKMGSEEEAHAFAAMMQRLMLQHELSEAEVARADTSVQKPEPIIEQMVNFPKFGMRVKKRRVAWMEIMARIVGKAHLCRFLLRPSSNQIWFVGTQKHVDTAEFVWAQLCKSADHMSDKEAYFFKLKCNREKRGKGDASGFRIGWLSGFTYRLTTRYELERNRTIEEFDTQTESTGQSLIVLNNAMTRVEHYLDDKFRRRRGASSLKGSSSNGEGSWAGVLSGRDAADQISLTPRKAIKS